MEDFVFDTNDSPKEYIVFYIKDGVTKSKFLPKELKDSFLKKFGESKLDIAEEELDRFIKENKNEN